MFQLNTAQKFLKINVLRLKMTSGLSLEPSPAHAKTTVRQFYSFLVVRMFTVLVPVAATVLFDGMFATMIGWRG